MPSLSELRKKEKAVRATRQITKAMKMVAGARLARGQRMWQDTKPFVTELENLIQDLLPRITIEGEVERFVEGKKPTIGTGVKKIGLLVVTGDKGLCGAFHDDVIRESERFLKSNPGTEIKLFLVGNKVSEFYKRRKTSAIANSYPNIFKTLEFRNAEHVAQDMLKAYIGENWSEIHVIYNKFFSVMKQQVVNVKILPLQKPEAKKTSASPIDFLFEPEEKEFFLSLIPLFVKTSVYRVLRESYAAELAARMTSMDNATRNAGRLIDQITLELNKVRQAIITNEIAEIIGTNEVIK
jgi:F-type H+-transporting ATPase subunit gamma